MRISGSRYDGADALNANDYSCALISGIKVFKFAVERACVHVLDITIPRTTTTTVYFDNMRTTISKSSGCNLLIKLSSNLAIF